MIEVKVVSDMDGHWYVIPSTEHDDFVSLGEDDFKEDEFNERFGKYRTNGDINNIQLYA